MQKLHQKHLLYRLGPISSLTNPYLLTLTLSCCKASAASVTRVQLFSSSKINKKDWESRNGRRKRERQRPGPAKFSKFAVREFARTRENHRDRQVGREPLISMASRIVKREGGELVLVAVCLDKGRRVGSLLLCVCKEQISFYFEWLVLRLLIKAQIK